MTQENNPKRQRRLRYPDGPGMWLWSEHSEPVEVWILGWYGETEEEAAEWTLDDLRFEIDGRRYVPAELGGNWKRVASNHHLRTCYPITLRQPRAFIAP